jgi:hypothetical protein
MRAKLPPKPLEKDIQRAILDYLKAKKYFCWRNNTGGFIDNRNHFYQFGSVGSGDILGMTQEGRFFSIEVKRPGGQPTWNQVQFMNEVNRNKGLAFVAYSVDDVEKNL